MNIGGKNIKNEYVWLGGAGLAGAFLLYRHFSGSSSSSGSSSAIDPVTGLPYSQDNVTDPMTGMTYLAEAQQYGSVAAAEAAVQGNYSSVGGGVSAQTVGYPTGGGSVTSTTGGFSTNAQWAQQVEQDLSAIGYAPQDVASAVGRYLAKLPLDSTQANIIQVALAEEGPPPQGSYSIIPQPSGGGGGGKPAAPAGLQASAGTSTVNLSWQPSAGATEYLVSVWHGQSHVHYAKQTATSLHLDHLHRHTGYGWYVEAFNSSGGASSAVEHFTTK